MAHEILAAVDLGSNSFSLQICRVIGQQIFPIDRMKETVRLAAGLQNRLLSDAAQQRALQTLARFAERLRGMPTDSVRVVGTNALRIAKNTHEFLSLAESTLGFPIEIISGPEEARLIYIGAAHSLPFNTDRRLVIDIGGGSTEIIIGRGYDPVLLDSVFMGCVSMTSRFFEDGTIDKKRLQQARLAARNELQSSSAEFIQTGWEEVIGTSGTAKSLSQILQDNNMGGPDLTPQGLEQIRHAILQAGHVERVALAGLRSDRRVLIPGGLAVMEAIFEEFGIQRMQYATGALRDGVLYDLLGRFHNEDMRETTVQQMMQRYHVDQEQAGRVTSLVTSLLPVTVLDAAGAHAAVLLRWAAQLHEIGISIAHAGYHKHSAYIVANADMPGFSRTEQQILSQLVLAHRGKLAKVRLLLDDPAMLPLILGLRLAVLLCRSRRDLNRNALHCQIDGNETALVLPPDWLQANPLTRMALETEQTEWLANGHRLNIIHA